MPNPYKPRRRFRKREVQDWAVPGGRKCQQFQLPPSNARIEGGKERREAGGPDENKLTKLKRCPSRVNFLKIHFGNGCLKAVSLQTLCNCPESESISDGPTDHLAY